MTVYRVAAHFREVTPPPTTFGADDRWLVELPFVVRGFIDYRSILRRRVRAGHSFERRASMHGRSFSACTHSASGRRERQGARSKLDVLPN
jgi:hypothetical protein